MPGLAVVDGSGRQHVLVLHGWALDSGIWSTSRPLTNVEEFTYAYFDFPGYGTQRSSPPAAGLDDMDRATFGPQAQAKHQRGRQRSTAVNRGAVPAALR